MDTTLCRIFGHLGLILSAAMILLVGQAHAAEFNARDFDVQVNMTPKVKEQTPDCSDNADGSQTCTKSLDSAELPETKPGTTTDLKAGDSGSFSIVCNTTQSGSVTYNQLGETITQALSAQGTRYQTCNWSMDFGSENILIGTVEGTLAIGAGTCRGEPAIVLTGPMIAHVVAGSGRYSGLVGKASIQDGDGPFQNEPLSGAPPCEGGEVGEPPSPAVAGLVSSAAQDGAEMTWALKLRRGKPRARIVNPPKRVPEGDKNSLRLASASKARCSAKATKGSRSKKLGRARDRDGDGEIKFKGSIAKKLGSGTWRIKAKCRVSYKGRRSTAKASRRVTIV